ncbi:hypothetical protein WBQ28_11130 [Pseudomonas syringae pv. syringae]|uniref:hypothetical protein n=1 Tax=Pseudomonas syringae TaxID=317 RepID=UPI003B0054FE
MQDAPERFVAVQNTQGKDFFHTTISVPEEPALPDVMAGPVKKVVSSVETVEYPKRPQSAPDAEATMGEEDTRDLLYRFWSLTSSQRREIMNDLGLLTEDEMKLPEPERYGRALILAAERDLLDQVATEVAKREK